MDTAPGPTSRPHERVSPSCRDPVAAEDQPVVGRGALDGIVRSVFAVTLPLSSARSRTSGAVAASLDEAIQQLDDVVRRIHHTALAAHSHDAADLGIRPSTPLQIGPAPVESLLIDEATQAVAQLDTVLTGLWVDAMASTDGDPGSRDRIGDAARFVRLAKRSLTSTALR